MSNLKLQTLFNKKWTNLLENYKDLKNGQYPGVYILAFTTKNLEGKPIKVKDVFYVGMSNSLGGVKQRLRQFCKLLSKSEEK